MVRSTFFSFDAEVILRIPLCTWRLEDFWAWGSDRWGRFSVSSVYRMLVKTKLQRESWLENGEGQSNTEEEEKSWTSLWNIKVPSKLKNFLWRLCQDSLPTADILSPQHVNNSRLLFVWIRG